MEREVLNSPEIEILQLYDGVICKVWNRPFYYKDESELLFFHHKFGGNV